MLTRVVASSDQPPSTDSAAVAPSARVVVLALGCWWVAAAALLPVVLDEAYYVAWSAHPARGYLDHPPLVALLAATAHLATGSPLAARLGTLVVAAISVIAMRRLLDATGLGDPRTRGAALLLRFGSLLALGLGFIATPDAPLLATWTLALAEAARALRGARSRWVSAGLATGLGLWSKYPVVLIGPVFLWAMWRADRRALATRWPYLGGLVALAVWSPQLHWNATHGWQTIAFQLGHGLAGSHRVASGENEALPRAEPPREAGPENALTSALVPADTRYHQRPPAERAWRKPFGRVRDYVAGELALWGFLLVPLAGALVEAVRRTGAASGATGDAQERPRNDDSIDPRMRPLLAAATVVPLGVFWVASFFSRAELHWPAPYLVGASLLLAPFVRRRPRGFVLAVSANALALGLLATHARAPWLPIPLGQDRVLRETHGFDRLARRLAHLDHPVFGTTYQLVSMVRFHDPRIAIGQWPGAARPSELTMRAAQAPLSWGDVTRAGGFWLVSSRPSIAHVPGAEARELIELVDCRDAPSEAPLLERRPGDPAPGCAPIHAWYLARYEVVPRAP
ncbi:MAG: glycosyltransferase family 39 protein [bacterium]